MHLFDVHAGRESLLVAGDDDAANGGIGLEGLQCLVELGDELRVQRV
jgi:hypothetical protein